MAGILHVLRARVSGRDFRAVGQIRRHGIQYIQPGKPNQNAYVERFNRTLRDELLDLHLFARLEDVREASYWWMLEYNEDRPQDSLGDLTPVEYAQTARTSSLEVSP